MNNKSYPSARLIALDWGTSSLRAWLLSADNQVLASRSSRQGIMQVEPGRFENIYRDLIGDWINTHGKMPVLACGMIGSRGGWAEAAYADCPADLGELASRLLVVDAQPAPLHIVPGVMQRSGPNRLADVMRGEETQVLGAMAVAPELVDEGLLVMPGTHCKWTTIADGRLAAFTTYMTGELFAVLREHSILGYAGPETAACDAEGAFLNGVDTAREIGSAGISAALFSTRSRVMAGELEAADATEYLSGLLIGDELRSALGNADARGPLRLVGDNTLCARYRRALSRFDVTDAAVIDDAARHGLWQIARAARLLQP